MCVFWFYRQKADNLAETMYKFMQIVIGYVEQTI